jgi:hypothetical protein
MNDSIPAGYISFKNEQDGHEYLLPDFMIPATNQAFDAHRKKIIFDVVSAYGGVSQHLCLFSVRNDHISYVDSPEMRPMIGCINSWPVMTGLFSLSIL